MMMSVEKYRNLRKKTENREKAQKRGVEKVEKMSQEVDFGYFCAKVQKNERFYTFIFVFVRNFAS